MQGHVDAVRVILARGGAAGARVGAAAADELRGWWAALSEGGEVPMPLEKQMWGDEYGSCTDRFGISWMVDITGV